MDKKYAIHNLKEAKEHLEELIIELEKSKNLNTLDGELLSMVTAVQDNFILATSV